MRTLSRGRLVRTLAMVAFCFSVNLRVATGWAETVGSPVIENKDLADIIWELEKQAGFKIVYRDFELPQEKKIAFTLPAPEDYPALVRFLNVLREEIEKYPQDFFRRGRVLTVILVKRHFYDEKPIEGAYQSQQHIILLDFLRSRTQPFKQRRAIHHELFHMIEVSARADGREFPEWEKLNSAEIKYGEKPPDGKSNLWAPVAEGFVTEYALTSPAEDRAELFASLMSAASQKLVLRWAQDDTVLAKKIEALQKFCAAYDSRLDQTFWERVRQSIPSTK